MFFRKFGGGGSKNHTASIYKPPPSATAPQRPQLLEYKLLVVGASNVPKVNFILQYVNNAPSLTISSLTYELNCSWKKKTLFEGRELMLELQDMPPPHTLNDTQHVDTAIRAADGFLFLYNCTSRASLKEIELLKGYIARTRQDIDRDRSFPMILVGREPNADEEKEVTFEEAKDLSYSFECPFTECSTLKQEEVNSVFQELVAEIARFKEAGHRKPVTPSNQAAKKIGFRYTRMDTEDLTFVQDGFEEDRQPKIKTASLDRVIERMTYEKYPYPKLVSTFMLTYRRYISPHDLLSLLVSRYLITPPSSLHPIEQLNWAKAVQTPVRLRVFNVLKYWLSNHFDDFKEDPKLRAGLEDFIRGPMKAHNQGCADQLLSKLLEMTEGERRRTIVTPAQAAPRSLVSKKVSPQTKFGFLDLNVVEIARQLTLIDHHFYRAITPKECLVWGTLAKTEKHKAPNIERVVKRFNAMSLFVKTEIVSHERTKQRALALTRWIQVVEACLTLNNFNAVMYIMAGLEDCAIHRLKESWKLVPRKAVEKFREIRPLVEARGAYTALRSTIKNSAPPLTPYLGMYLGDLTFIDDGNKDFVDQRLINIEKCEQMGDVINEIQQWQRSFYCLDEVPQIKDYFMQQFEINDQEVYRISCTIEPRALTNAGAAGTGQSNSGENLKTTTTTTKTKVTTVKTITTTTTNHKGGITPEPERPVHKGAEPATEYGTPYSSFFDAVSARMLEEGEPALKGSIRLNSPQHRSEVPEGVDSVFNNSSTDPDSPVVNRPNYSYSMDSEPSTTTFTATRPLKGGNGERAMTGSPPIGRRADAPVSTATPTEGGGAQPSAGEKEKSGPPSAAPPPTPGSAVKPSQTPKPLKSMHTMSPASLKTWTSETNIGKGLLLDKGNNNPGGSGGDARDQMRQKRLSSPGLVPISPSQHAQGSARPDAGGGSPPGSGGNRSWRATINAGGSTADARRGGRAGTGVLARGSPPVPPRPASPGQPSQPPQPLQPAPVPEQPTTTPPTQATPSTPQQPPQQQQPQQPPPQEQPAEEKWPFINDRVSKLEKEADDSTRRGEEEPLIAALQKWISELDNSATNAPSNVTPGGGTQENLYHEDFLLSKVIETVMRNVLLYYPPNTFKDVRCFDLLMELLKRVFLGEPSMLKTLWSHIPMIKNEMALTGGEKDVVRLVVTVLSFFKILPLDKKLLADLQAIASRSSELIFELQKKEATEGVHSVQLNQEKIEITKEMIVSGQKLLEVSNTLLSVDVMGSRKCLTIDAATWNNLDGQLAALKDTHPCLEQFYEFARQKLLRLVDDDFSVFGVSLISTADEHLDTFELHLQKIFNFMFLLHKRLSKLTELKTAPETLATSITDLRAGSSLMQKIQATWDGDVEHVKRLFSEVDFAEQQLYEFLGYYSNLKSDRPLPYSNSLKFESGVKAPPEVTRVFGTLLRVRKLQQLVEELLPEFNVEGSDEAALEDDTAAGDGEKGARKNPPVPPRGGSGRTPPASGPTPGTTTTAPPTGVPPRAGRRSIRGVPRGSPLGLVNSASGRGRGN